MVTQFYVTTLRNCTHKIIIYSYLGRGVVRILFRSPESAEVFVKQGFQRIGEASYVRWPELMPQEMGPELYSEL